MRHQNKQSAAFDLYKLHDFFFRMEPNKKKRMCFFRVRVCSCSKHFSECILCNRHIKQIVWSKSNKKSKETAKYKQLLNLGRTLLPFSPFFCCCLLLFRLVLFDTLYVFPIRVGNVDDEGREVEQGVEEEEEEEEKALQSDVRKRLSSTLCLITQYHA